MKKIFNRIICFCLSLCFYKKASMQPLHLCPSPVLDTSCHILMARLGFGTNYVWKSNRKCEVGFLTELMKMDGWAEGMEQTPDSLLSVSISAQRSLHVSHDGNKDMLCNGKHNGCGQMENG